jgi:LPS sulfotransferase NodH
MLCGLLKSSGVAGRAEEYFWRGDEAFWTKRWDLSGPAESVWPDYLRAALSEGTTPNGVFAAKVMWAYLGDLLTNLATLPASSGLDAGQLLRRTFPKLRFVFIRRADTIAQAVSFARAHLTQEWYRPAGSEPGPEPDYDYGLIDGLLRLVDEHNTAWLRWFDDHDIEPFTLTYEDLVADPVGVTRQVLTFLDIDLSSAQPIIAQTERQGAALNTAWVARFQAERRSRQATG